MANPNEDLILRLKKQMEVKKINARELAEKASVGRSFVYDILNGKSSNPTSKKLAAVAQVLEVSVPYLLGGSNTISQGLVFPEGLEDSDDTLVSIPALSVESAKSGNVIINDENSDNPYYFRKSWMEQVLKLDPKDLRVVFVEGDSMEPTLADSDMVLIDTKRNKATPPGIFVLFDGEGLLVKRLESISSGKMIKVISDNKKYYSYDTEVKNIEIIGRIVWFARKL